MFLDIPRKTYSKHVTVPGKKKRDNDEMTNYVNKKKHCFIDNNSSSATIKGPRSLATLLKQLFSF